MTFKQIYEAIIDYHLFIEARRIALDNLPHNGKTWEVVLVGTSCVVGLKLDDPALLFMYNGEHFSITKRTHKKIRMDMSI